MTISRFANRYHWFDSVAASVDYTFIYSDHSEEDVYPVEVTGQQTKQALRESPETTWRKVAHQVDLLKSG